MTTVVDIHQHNQNMADFEKRYNVPSDVWSFEQGEDFAEYIINKYGLTSYDDYQVDTDCTMSDYDADCLTLGHDY